MATNIPVTIWNPTDGNGEYTSTGQLAIVDPSGVALVDPQTAAAIVDTGSQFTPIPATTWTEDDSK